MTSAVDQNGQTVDFFLRKRRDVGAAKTFFRRAWKKHGDPLSITLDAYAASHRAVQEWKESGEMLYQKMRVRSCAYLNHVVAPDHRRVEGGWHRPRSRVAAGEGGLNTDGKEERFVLRLLGSGVCNRTARLTLPSGLRSWVLRANPLFEFLMHLVGFDTLFRRQHLVKLR